MPTLFAFAKVKCSKPQEALHKYETNRLTTGLVSNGKPELENEIGVGGGINWEMGIDIYTLLYIK